MTPRPRKAQSPRKGDAPMVKTTLLMPEELWRRAKIRALEENRDLRDLLIEGLEVVLKHARGGK